MSLHFLSHRFCPHLAAGVILKMTFLMDFCLAFLRYLISMQANDWSLSTIAFQGRKIK